MKKQKLLLIRFKIKKITLIIVDMSLPGVTLNMINKTYVEEVLKKTLETFCKFYRLFLDQIHRRGCNFFFLVQTALVDGYHLFDLKYLYLLNFAVDILQPVEQYYFYHHLIYLDYAYELYPNSSVDLMVNSFSV